MSHSTLRQFIIDSQCLFPGYEKASVEEIKSGEEICKYKLKKSKRTLSNVINNEGEYNPRMIREAFLNKIRFFLYPEQRVNTTDDLISDGEFIVKCIQFLCNKTYGNIRLSSFLSILTLGILDFEELKEKLVVLFNQLVSIVCDDTLSQSEYIKDVITLFYLTIRVPEVNCYRIGYKNKAVDYLTFDELNLYLNYNLFFVQKGEKKISDININNLLLPIKEKKEGVSTLKELEDWINDIGIAKEGEPDDGDLYLLHDVMDLNNARYRDDLMYRHRLVFKERFEIAKRNMEEILNTQCIAILKDKLTLLKADIQESQTSLLKNDKKLIEFIDNLNNKSRYSTSQNLNLKLMVTDLYIGHFILSKPSGSCENINPDSFELFTDFINLSLSEKDTAFIDKFYETMEKDLFVQCPNIYKYNNICKLRQLLHTIRFIINTLKTFDNDNKNEFFSLQSSMIDEEE